ncbi:MAG: VanW family protein [Treponema sp.]|nr:VanW family protein [Treponema sp.]
MDESLKKVLINRIKKYESPKRIAFTSKFPIFKTPVIFLRCSIRSIQNILDAKMSNKKKIDFFEHVIANYKTALRKDLKDADSEALTLQENKIINMKIAAEKINGIEIEPGKIFSFWNTVGNPSYKNGYADGRVYSNVNVIKGVGGGLCQLSTFLYWMFLHAPVEILERHPHTIDVNPSSKENVSSRSGATVLYNFIDLKMKNDFNYPIQIKLWFAENHMEGQVLSAEKTAKTFRIVEKNHCYIKKDGKIYQYNEIFKEVSENGSLIKTEMVIENFYQVLYDLPSEYIKENDYNVYDYSELIGET